MDRTSEELASLKKMKPVVTLREIQPQSPENVFLSKEIVHVCQIIRCKLGHCGGWDALRDDMAFCACT